LSWYEKVRVIADFPQPGVLFRDIMPALADADAFSEIVSGLQALVEPWQPELLGVPEARGFLVGGALACRLGVGVVAIRKPGKLPEPVFDEHYTLEYGENRLQMEAQLPVRGRRVVIVDDVLATGGTVAACARLIAQAGGDVVGLAFLIELAALNGRQRWSDAEQRVKALCRV
jgi:adenine phosphoribosyltransferase